MLRILLLIILCFNYSCIDYKVRDQVDFERELTMEVNNIKGSRGVLILNNKFMLSASCLLVYDKSFPTWIKEDDSYVIYRPKNHVFSPYITDIPTPYKLIKKKNTDFFHIIKFNDTLKFELYDL